MMEYIAYFCIVMSWLWIGVGSSNMVHEIGTPKTLAWLLGGIWWILAAIFLVVL